MKIRYFRCGYHNKPELNFIGKRWNFRIAGHQLALWFCDLPVFNLVHA